MKILIDECLPRKLKQSLIGHDVKTVPEMGWAGKKNGELLRLITGAFDVFITFDKQMEYQQNLKNLSIGIIVLSAKKNRLDFLLPLMPSVQKALETIQPSDVMRIDSQNEA